MAAKDTFSTQTLITKTPVNGHAVSSGDQTGFGARARARHASREEGKDKKKNCLLCRPDKDGLVGPSFLGFSGYHKKPQKRRKHFSQGLPASPYPHLAAFPDSTKLRATFGDRVFISATGNKHKIQRWRDAGPFPDVFVFSDFKVCRHYFHALRANNLIQHSFVAFFVCFLTDVLIGSCFLPQQFSPASIMCLPVYLLHLRFIIQRILHSGAKI